MTGVHFECASLEMLSRRREANSQKKIFLKPYAHLPKGHDFFMVVSDFLPVVNHFMMVTDFHSKKRSNHFDPIFYREIFTNTYQINLLCFFRIRQPIVMGYHISVIKKFNTHNKTLSRKQEENL